MTLVVYAEPSREAYPGHMVVGEESDSREFRYFGYRFDPASLPTEYRPPARWRDYLVANKIPGLIVEESRYVRHLQEASGRAYWEKRAESSTSLESYLPPRDEWQPHAYYSFNPDDFSTEELPCYNCVTWATTIANRLIVGFLPVVRQGRINLALGYLVQPSRRE